MAAWRYAHLRNIFLTLEEKFRISKRPCNSLFFPNSWVAKLECPGLVPRVRVLFMSQRLNPPKFMAGTFPFPPPF